jgi:hypothetical protein
VLGKDVNVEVVTEEKYMAGSHAALRLGRTNEEWIGDTVVDAEQCDYTRMVVFR